MNILKIILMTCLVKSSSTIQDRYLNYKRTTDCAGQIGCAANNPTLVPNKSRSRLNCAVKCKLRASCVNFNYFSNSSTCQLFDFIPNTIKTITPCKSYYEILKAETVSIGENLALHRQACQSTTATFTYTLEPWLAVDGLLGTDPNLGQCSHTNDPDTGENWWIVDIIRVVVINYVRILTRTGPAMHFVRYNNLTIGVTNTSSLLKRPVRNTYPLCGVFLGSAGSGVWIQINCSSSIPPSRYVIVQQTPTYLITGGYLCLCEVEVF